MNPNSFYKDVSVKSVREIFARCLAKRENVNFNDEYIVIGVPNSGIIYGKEYSKVLNLNPGEFEFLPNNTADALNAGSIGAIVCMIEKVRGKKKVYLTGGDGKFLLKFIKNAEFIEDLVFRGMKKR